MGIELCTKVTEEVQPEAFWQLVVLARNLRTQTIQETMQVVQLILQNKVRIKVLCKKFWKKKEKKMDKIQ